MLTIDTLSEQEVSIPFFQKTLLLVAFADDQTFVNSVLVYELPPVHGGLLSRLIQAISKMQKAISHPTFVFGRSETPMACSETLTTFLA